MSDVRIIKQDYHRNGVGGDGFVVSLVDWPEAAPESVTSHFVAVSFFASDSTLPREEQVEYMRTHTAVLSIDQMMVGNIGQAWRGADSVGPAVTKVWARACMDGTAFALPGSKPMQGWDPFAQEEA